MNGKKQMTNHDITVVTCANCYGIAIMKGKQHLDCCPQCKSNDKDLVRARYWENGEPDYEVNLIR